MLLVVACAQVGGEAPHSQVSSAETPYACSAHDSVNVVAATENFIKAWNMRDEKGLRALFSDDGWFAIKLDPQAPDGQAPMHSAADIVPVAQVHWQTGETFTYDGIREPIVTSGGTASATQLLGMRSRFTDGTIREVQGNKFAVRCPSRLLRSFVMNY